MILSLSLVSSLLAGLAASQSTPFPYDAYKTPSNFTATRMRDCTYQLTFARDRVDSTFNVVFEAQYATDPSRLIQLEDCNKSWMSSRVGSNFQSGIGLWALDDEYALMVYVIEDACSRPYFGGVPESEGGRNGELPATFRVHIDAPWASDPFTANGVVGSLPGSPGSINATTQEDGQVLVEWDAVEGATGYYVLAEGLFDNSEVGDTAIYNTLDSPASPTTGLIPASFRLQRVAAFAKGEGRGIVSFLPETRWACPDTGEYPC